jgi:ABC-type nickel/cobalt efflux system permease component RcnA
MPLEGLIGQQLGPALVLAFLLGAGHALTPGHGKTVVAAYLVGSRGRVSDAVWLGMVVTATHTALVFALGLAALYAASSVPVERILPWLQVGSGALMFAMGLWLLYSRLRHLHHHHHGHTHSHAEKGSLTALGISSGMTPCPEALAVLMLSVSTGRIATGLALLLSFSLGLAAILIAIGTAMVLAGPALQRHVGETKWARVLPIGSALVITVAGAILMFAGAKA